MFHAKVSRCAEGERGDRGVGTEEALIVAMVGYAVGTVGVVVDEAEIVGRSGEDLGELAKMIKAVGYGARSAGFVSIWRYWFGRLAVNEGAIWGERGRGINAKHRRKTRSIYMGVGTIALDSVLHSVEEERTSQEVKQISLNALGYIRLEKE